MKHAARYIYIALTALLGTACSDTANTLFTPSEQPIHEMEIGFSVSETEWEGAAVSMTRSGETLEALEKSGFGVFCEVLAMTNQEVTWDTITGTWDYGTKILWPKSVVEELKKGDNGTPTEIFAYAPYDSSVGVATDGKSIAADNTKDWLWASPKISSDGIIHLEFKHALAKLSFGTITNNYGHPITLESVTIKGSSTTDGPPTTDGKLYTSGTLSLASGTWEFGEPIDPIKPIAPNEDPIEIKNGETASFGIETKMLISQKIEVEIAVKVTEAQNGSDIIKTDKTIKKNVTLEQGKNTEINLTVGQNHEVVIK